MNSFDIYYIISSDLLNISHEKYLIFFLYKFICQFNKEVIGLLFSAVRFNFLEMQTLFDIARDHETVRKN